MSADTRPKSAINRLGQVMSRLAGRFVPSPFVLAVLLTLLVLALAVTTGQAVAQLPMAERLNKVLIGGWGGALFGAGGLQFAFQMVLVLVTGYAFALSPPIQRLIDKLAAIPRSAAQASAVVALVSCVSGYIHWGLGAVAGALLAREIGRSWAERGKALHYPLMGAAAYSGLLVWHGGLSGSAPLKVAESGHFLEKTVGVIPVDQTLFSGLNLVVTVSLIITTVLVYYLLTPRNEADCVPFSGPTRSASPKLVKVAKGDGTQHPIIAALEDSLVIPALLGGLCLAYVGHAFVTQGFKALNLNTVNLFFLAAGLLLHGSPRSYGRAAADGAKGAVGIVLQFPLYFGILGMLKASGLIVQLSDFFVSISNATTFPIFAYLSAGLVNLFVPSGGGQWAVQGPVLMNAAKELGLDPSKAIMALAYGDAWTNMLQPFWALPLLGIMGLKARDIIGYTTILFGIAAPVTIFWLLVL